MILMQRQRVLSLDEYLDLEAMSEIRHEYFEGQMLAMSGGSYNHNEIAINTRNALKSGAGRACRGFVNDIRIETASGLFTYPDVVLICGTPQQGTRRGVTATNPVVLAEVLSTSTRNYDRGDKFGHYRSISTLRDYLLIDQYAIDVEHRWRDSDEWRSARYTKLEDAFTLTGLPITVSLSEIYVDIELTAAGA